MDGSRNPEANGMPRKLPPLDDEDPLDSSGAPARKKKPRGRRPSVDGFGRSSGGGGGGPGDGGSDGRADAADGSGGIDRERLLNDILNTGVMGALIGGFALSQIQMKFDNSQPFDVPITCAASSECTRARAAASRRPCCTAAPTSCQTRKHHFGQSATRCC
jgi:hypothetical protein